MGKNYGAVRDGSEWKENLDKQAEMRSVLEPPMRRWPHTGMASGSSTCSSSFTETMRETPASSMVTP
jgi:hypothetical protein